MDDGLTDDILSGIMTRSGWDSAKYPILETQMEDIGRKSILSRGEVQLMLYILEDALHHKAKCKGYRDKKKLYRCSQCENDEIWIKQKQEGTEGGLLWIHSFENICLILGLELKKVRTLFFAKEPMEFGEYQSHRRHGL